MKPEQVIATVVKILFQAGASRWDVPSKGKLLAAVNVSLQPTEANDNVTHTASKEVFAEKSAEQE